MSKTNDGTSSSPPSWATAGGGENATRARVPGWMVGDSGPGGEGTTTAKGQHQDGGGAMDAFLPKFRQFLTIVDPAREKGSSDEDLLAVLRDYDTPEGLFASLDEQYKAEWHQHQDGVQPAPPAPAAATSTASSKPRCQYGNKCYRKNPQHMRDFDHSHSPLLPSQSGGDTVTQSPDKRKKRKREKDSPEESGESRSAQVPDDVTDSPERNDDDPDYTPDTSGRDSPSPPPSAPARPVCMYGRKCYRKNPVHFKELDTLQHQRGMLALMTMGASSPVHRLILNHSSHPMGKYATKAECDACIKALHNTYQWRTGSTWSLMQVRYAIGELDGYHNKLFVGGIPAYLDDGALTASFSTTYGPVRELVSLRRGPGQSTNAVMVRFVRRESVNKLLADSRRRQIYLCGVYCPAVRVSYAHYNRHGDRVFSTKATAEDNVLQEGEGVPSQRRVPSQSSTIGYPPVPQGPPPQLQSSSHPTMYYVPSGPVGRQLCIGNIPSYKSFSDVTDLLTPYGSILHITAVDDEDADHGTMTVSAVMASDAEASAAEAALNGYVFPDDEAQLPLNVSRVTPPQEWSPAYYSYYPSPTTDTIPGSIAMTKIMAGLLKAQETLARHSPVYAGSGSFPQAPLRHHCHNCSGEYWLPPIITAAAAGHIQLAANLTNSAIVSLPAECRQASRDI
ncbi:hypothetical protein Pmar_PMAR006087 [Perkinsus marinus ATCC 50983]|uniref:RRM domain-containing protein n=1 Tax=Perkinsus marinus (strain ATCC 50983 / TXsc) TaxID=423536 RepID=C5LA65_PERM5|nr:hypothetical protein Pmar_PMAR006087 [Perkinsus marinus ATCC 50983]EER06321.1 hypothetical protein Pmar_PMAR006087 [Perkinsus marinus ATCC 50983]|eukprot:XP_002774505.1 hypothetical protein Pmar_PMAR006087 [Perkinsus marinus ATCC 50983]